MGTQRPAALWTAAFSAWRRASNKWLAASGQATGCVRCSAPSHGPPVPLTALSSQVVMCHNHMQSATEFENMLVHELVHAFDHCRAADLDWGNCKHHACSEARARAGASVRPALCAESPLLAAGAGGEPERGLRVWPGAVEREPGADWTAPGVREAKGGAECGAQPSLPAARGGEGGCQRLLRRLCAGHGALRQNPLRLRLSPSTPQY